ncbi:MAG: MerR family transcriptional regulator [Myxococcales bacterium]|nr:MerR family transcriptional regulator [Myxococcales bacterium]
MTRARSAAAPSGPAYSIRVVSRMTSIEPETLRMWERRYGFPTPSRTEGGARVYSESDVTALNLIVRAMREGYRPGEIVGKSIPELEAIARRATPADAGAGGRPGLDDLFAALLRDDVRELRAITRRAAVLLGPARFVSELAQPAAARAGDMWSAGELEVRHEHVLSEVLSTQLHLLASTFDDAQSGPIVVLATLPGEQHGLPLDLVAVYLGSHGARPHVVGVDTPPEQIAEAARAFDADAVAIGVSGAADRKRSRRDLRTLLDHLPRKVSVWLGGGGAAELGQGGEAGVSVIASFADLDAALRAPRRRA